MSTLTNKKTEHNREAEIQEINKTYIYCFLLSTSFDVIVSRHHHISSISSKFA